MAARRVSDSQRQVVLQSLREQLGYDNYEHLVNQLGEDGLIEAALTQAERPRQEPAPAPRRSPFVAALSWPMIIFGGADWSPVWAVLILAIIFLVEAFKPPPHDYGLMLGGLYLCGVVWHGVVVPIWRLLSRWDGIGTMMTIICYIGGAISIIAAITRWFGEN